MTTCRQASVRGLATIFLEGYRYQKGGMMLLDLTVDANRQLSLDETLQSVAGRERGQRRMATLDKFNSELGKSTVGLGLPRKGNAWALVNGQVK